MPYTAPSTWVAGDVLTAAQLNAQIRDQFLAIFPLGAPDVAWTSFTPALTQGAAVTKTVTYARYTRIGRLIVAQVFLNVTGAGTAANSVLVGLPVAAALPTQPLECGTGTVFDLSANTAYQGQAIMNTAQGVNFRTGAAGVLGSTTFTAAFASGDQVSYSVMYEAAS